MPFRRNILDENPLKKLAEQAPIDPGMYLIALREHLRRGRKLIGELMETVTEALPQSPKISTSTDKEEQPS